MKLAGGELAYRTNGQITMRGNLDLTLGPAGFTGDLAGFVDGLRAFSAEGKGKIGVNGLPGLEGDGLVSSVGAAACGKALFVRAGFGVRWEDFPKPKIMVGSCGIGEWRVAPALASQAGSRSFRVRRGTRQLTLSAVGEGAAPAVTLRGPGGVTFSAPPTGALIEPNRLAFRYEGDATSYFAVGRPRAGRWTLTADPGSVPVTRFRRAGDIEVARIAARVSGRGRLPAPALAREQAVRTTGHSPRAEQRRHAQDRGHARWPWLGALPAGNGRQPSAARRRVRRAPRAARGPAHRRALPGAQRASCPATPRRCAPPGIRCGDHVDTLARCVPPRGSSAYLRRSHAALPAAPGASRTGRRHQPPRPGRGQRARPRPCGPGRAGPQRSAAPLIA